MAVAYWSGCTKFVTFTAVGETWTTRRNRVKRVTHAIREDGYRWDVVWCVEPNPAETGHHVHALVLAPFVEQERLSILAAQSGLGAVVWIERARDDAVGNYAAKAGLYSSKGASGGPAEYGAWLDLAGGRGVHWSRRAFNGATFPEAYRSYLDAKGWVSSDPGPWVRERADGSETPEPERVAREVVQLALDVSAVERLDGLQDGLGDHERPSGDVR